MGMRTARSGLKSIAVAAMNLGLVWPITQYYRGRVKMLNGARAADCNAPKLLVLQDYRFRGELELLDKNGPLRIATLDQTDQLRLLGLFHPDDVKADDIFCASVKDGTIARKERFRRFLSKFIPGLYEDLNIVGTLGGGLHYWRDADWGAVSSDLSYPYVVIHRENLLTRRSFMVELVARFQRYNPFQGDFVITQSQQMREVAIESGFVTPSQIGALGAMRMDRLLQQIGAGQMDQKHVVLFSFSEGAGLGHKMPNWTTKRNSGWVNLFDSVHTSFARIAQTKPTTDFIIKVKLAPSGVERIQQTWRDNGLDAAQIPNLKITSETDPHDLILNASVVVGFNSTAVMEAAVAGKPVVVPIYHEANQEEYEPFIQYGDRLDLFDVASSETELVAMISDRTRDPQIEPQCQQRRDETFEQFVSPLSGDAVNQYVSTIEKIYRQPSGSNVIG